MTLIRHLKENCSFLKKRTKRLLFLRGFHDRGHGRDLAAAPGTKVFWFFSSEKKSLRIWENIACA
jgi:hypothetical protein